MVLNPGSSSLHEGSLSPFVTFVRAKVDRSALDFVKGHVFDPADFVIRTDGVCRLNPEMARMVVARGVMITPHGS
jgi:hypothetical protein